MDIDWQNNFTEFKDRCGYVLQTEKWADCHFMVGTPPNQKLIGGHKLILAMGSPVFERMFFGNLPDKSDPIVIPDVQPEAFMAMLEYIYSDRINILSFDKACELCYVAKKYMLPHVVERCTHFLWADLSPKNACRAYEFAKLFDEPRLMQSSMELIAANTREVIADPNFLDIEVSTLMAILDQNRLNIDSELDLFNCLLKFASERGILNDNSGNNESNSVNNDDIVVEEIKMEPDVAALMHNHIDSDGDEDDEHFLEHTQQSVRSSDMTPSPSSSSSSSSAGAVAIVADANVSDEVVVVDNDASSMSSRNNNISESLSAAENAANIITIMDAQRTLMDETMLRQAVKKIRFLTMTPQQFAEGPARSKLLQQHESLAILIKISSPTINDCPMPEGFCTSRSTRNFYESHRQRDLPSFRFPTNPNSSLHNVFLTANTNSNAIVRGFGITNNTAASSTAGGSSGGGGDANASASTANHNLCNHTPMFGLFDGPSSSAAASAGHVTLGPAVHNDAPWNNANNDNDEAMHGMQRAYCVRTVNQQFDYRNSSVTDCGLTFQVDTNILILGVQVPTQVLCGELLNSAGFRERYTEVLYAHIQDMQNSRIAYTHCTSRVRYDSLLDITFDRPVYIYRNQIYKIYVVFNKVGWYTMYSCVPDAVCHRVNFMFNVGNPDESVRDGLIHAIIFQTPRNNMLEQQQQQQQQQQHQQHHGLLDQQLNRSMIE